MTTEPEETPTENVTERTFYFVEFYDQGEWWTAHDGNSPDYVDQEFDRRSAEAEVRDLKRRRYEVRMYEVHQTKRLIG